MSYLMEVSIGPVQSFIASARRTRDFWFGSLLLSELSKATARTIIVTDQSAKLIFPAPYPDQADLAAWSELSVSNNIIAIVENNPKQIGDKVKKDVLEFAINLLSEDAMERIGDLLPNNAIEIVRQQIQDLIEVMWVAVPLKADKSDYAETRKLLAEIMARRKATRTFQQPTWVGNMMESAKVHRQKTDLVKSSLDGQREAILHVSSKESGKMPEGIDFKPGEHLSGIDLLKRLGQSSNPQEHKFASTSHMAAMPLLKRIETMTFADVSKVKQQWDAYYGALPPHMQQYEKVREDVDTKKRFVGNVDGSVFFPERALDYLTTDKLDKMRDIQQKYAYFFNKFKQEYPDIQQPQPYYAFLKADGDSMGVAIDKITGWEQHQQFSQTLSDFALLAKSIIKKHYGASIYTGGDDVVALLPLHTAIQCAKELSALFYTKMDDFKKKHTISWEATPTLSAGLVIAHHLEPLTEVYAMAGNVEKLAKDYKSSDDNKKNALAIVVSKRSGGDTIAVGHWNELIPRLNIYIELAQIGKIPGGVGYELRQLAHEFSTDAANKLAMERAEVIRILKRKKMDKEDLDKIQKEFTKYPSMPSSGSAEKTGISVTDQFSSELILAQFFAQSKNLAGLQVTQ